MAKPRIPCPTCGSDQTLRRHGAFALTAWCFQLRFECQACGQRFLTLWEGEMLKCYDNRPLTRCKAKAEAGA